ncbi:MAG TPA: hypothetical protein VNO79_06895 [Actinomycetota bacterium]|nr:hypothetical protein [Actinomycetota bacterium]
MPDREPAGPREAAMTAATRPPVVRPLRDDQIRATLERHGYSPDTHVLGITYGLVVTVNVYAARLVVPTDILRQPPPVEERGPSDRGVRSRRTAH